MDNMSINLEALHSGLKSIKALRSSVLEVFKFLGDGAPVAYGDEERERFINEVQASLATVRIRMRELETACTLLGSPNPPLSLGNSGLLSQDPAYEKTQLYSELIKSHRWFDKVVEISSQAHSLLHQNSIKRAYSNPGLPSVKQLRVKPPGVNVSPQQVDHTCATLIRLFPEFTFQVVKPYGASAIMLVSLPRTLKCLIMLRGLIIDWVNVKGFNEDFNNENEKLDPWTGSRYLVFQKITDHASAAMLHFYSPHMPEIAIKSFLTWLRGYSTLFTAPCRKCNNRLHNNMPPTWRDVRNLDAYHESCKP